MDRLANQLLDLGTQRSLGSTARMLTFLGLGVRQTIGKYCLARSSGFLFYSEVSVLVVSGIAVDCSQGYQV